MSALLGKVRFVVQAEQEQLGDDEVTQNQGGLFVAEATGAHEQHNALREEGQGAGWPGVQEQFHAQGHEFGVVDVRELAAFDVQKERGRPGVRFSFRADGVAGERRETGHALFVPGSEEHGGVSAHEGGGGGVRGRADLGVCALVLALAGVLGSAVQEVQGNVDLQGFTAHCAVPVRADGQGLSTAVGAGRIHKIQCAQHRLIGLNSFTYTRETVEAATLQASSPGMSPAIAGADSVLLGLQDHTQRFQFFRVELLITP